MNSKSIVSGQVTLEDSITVIRTLWEWNIKPHFLPLTKRHPVQPCCRGCCCRRSYDCLWSRERCILENQTKAANQICWSVKPTTLPETLRSKSNFWTVCYMQGWCWQDSNGTAEPDQAASLLARKVPQLLLGERDPQFCFSLELTPHN